MKSNIDNLINEFLKSNVIKGHLVKERTRSLLKDTKTVSVHDFVSTWFVGCLVRTAGLLDGILVPDDANGSSRDYISKNAGNLTPSDVVEILKFFGFYFLIVFLNSNKGNILYIESLGISKERFEENVLKLMDCDETDVSIYQQLEARYVTDRDTWGFRFYSTLIRHVFKINPEGLESTSNDALVLWLALSKTYQDFVANMSQLVLKPKTKSTLGGKLADGKISITKSKIMGALETMNVFARTKTVSKVEISLTENKVAVVQTTVSANIQTLLFIFFLDRVLNNLNDRPRNFLISEFDEIIAGIADDFESNPSQRSTEELGAYYLGTDYSLVDSLQGQIAFWARGKLLQKGEGVFMQTSFRPVLMSNYKSELFAIESVHAFYHFLTNNASPRTRLIMGSLLDHATKYYEDNGFGITDIGQAPTQALKSLIKLEQDKNSDWFREVGKLLL